MSRIIAISVINDHQEADIFVLKIKAGHSNDSIYDAILNYLLGHYGVDETDFDEVGYSFNWMYADDATEELECV